MNVQRVYDERGKKRCIAQIKQSNYDLDLIGTVFTPSSKQFIYYSEILTECIKSQKFTCNRETGRRILQALRDNISFILQLGTEWSPDEIKSIAKSCLDDVEVLKLPALFAILLVRVKNCHVIRDNLILIFPLIIYYSIEHQGSIPVNEYRKAVSIFDNKQAYNTASWYSCLLKLYPVKESAVTNELLKFCLHEISQTYTCNHFIYFDIISTCILTQHRHGLEQIEDAEYHVIFDLTVNFTDDRGVNLSKVCEEIQTLCLKSCPSLMAEVKKLSEGPWYSRNTLIYLNTWLLHCSEVDSNAIHPKAILRHLVRCLGYNRIEHNVIRVIKTLLYRFLKKDNFLDLLQVCLDIVINNPSIIRIIGLYIATIFNNKLCFPPDFQEILVGLVTDSPDEVKMILFYTFYQRFKYVVFSLLVTSKINRSNISEIQCLLITLLTRNMAKLPNTTYLLETYRHILTLPCPAVRQHAISTIHNIIPVLKSSETFNEQLNQLLISHITMDTPFHSLSLSLEFFIRLQKAGVMGEAVQQSLLNLLDGLHDHDDHDIMNLVRKLEDSIKDIVKVPSVAVSYSPDSVTSFCKTATLISDFKSLTENPITNRIAEIQQHIENLPNCELQRVSTSSFQIIDCLLNMISSEADDSGVYSAPSFEETFVILESSLIDSVLCEDAGKLVWCTIARMLCFLSVLGDALLVSSMDKFVSDEGWEDEVDTLYNIGFTCIQCIFRCRHRSVIKASIDTLRTLSASVSTRPTAHCLPKKWIAVLMNVLTEPATSSLSRRSAGLPEALESVLQCTCIILTHSTVDTLLVTVKQPYVNMSEHHDVPQVHALHMLRLILTSAKLRLHMLPYTAEICGLCYSGFVHTWWIVRNASLMLFTELINFVLGHKNTEFSCGYRSSISVGELKQSHPGIYQHIICNLSNTHQTSIISPSVYLSLTFMTKLYPGLDSDEDYADLLFGLLSSPAAMIRSVAARTLSVVCLPETKHRLARIVIEELNSRDHNTVNGMLQFLLDCSKSKHDVCDGVVTIDQLGKSLTKEWNVLKMVPPNLSLVVELMNTIAEHYIVNNNSLQTQLSFPLSFSGAVEKISNVARESSTFSYPSNLFDHIGVWFLTTKSYPSAFEHITRYITHLTGIFWRNATPEFYRSFDQSAVTWVLNRLQYADAHSEFCVEYLASFIFEILNVSVLEKVDLPKDVMKLLSAGNYPVLQALISISYGIDINSSALCKRIDSQQSFISATASFFQKFYQIKRLIHPSATLASLVTSALLHTQSEDDELRDAAVWFCVRFSGGKGTNVTCLCAMKSVVSKIGESFVDNKLFMSALQMMKVKVVSGAAGFTVASNAHFDKSLFLGAVNILT